MSIKPKHIVIGGIALGLLILGASAAKAATTGKNLEFRLLPKLRKLDFDSLQIEVDAEITNPKGGSLLISDPKFILSHTPPNQSKAVGLALIDLEGRTFNVRPHSTAKLSDPDQLGGKLILTVPYSKLAVVAPGIFNAVTGIGPAFVADVHYRADVKAPNLPRFNYEDSDQLTIGKPAV
ncbi:MAG: hypothetical protein AAF998_09395 [Bacteroidota bacterium]